MWETVAWVVLAGLATCAAASLLRLDESNVAFVLTTGLTPLLYLPAEVVLVAAAVKRRCALAAAAAILVALHAVWLHDALEPDAAASGASAAPTLTVVEANLYLGNSAGPAEAADVLVGNPDVVVLLEASPKSFAPFERPDQVARFPYRIVRLDRGSRGLALLSRRPLTDVRVHPVIGGRHVLAAAVRVGDHPVRVLGVHVSSPLADRLQWRRQLAAVAAIVSGETRPVVVAGDFNATPFHHSLQQLMKRGSLYDAQAATRAWWPMTWPRTSFLPPFLQLDHILVSQGVRVESTRSIDVSGSDHRGVTAVLTLG